MNLAEMKKMAKEAGIEFYDKATSKQMEKKLSDAGLIELSPYSNLDYEIEEIIQLFKIVESPLDVKKANQKRTILRKKLEIEPSKLKKFLAWERSRKLISVADNYKLNEFEKDETQKICVCIVEIPSGGTHEEIGKEYGCNSYYDESRQMDMYTVYVDRAVAPEEQIDKALSWKISKGFMPEQSDYKDEKVLWHRMTLNEREFNKYFRIENS